MPVIIGKYEIIEELGRGGFATVYKARDTKLDRIVALKVLHPQRTTDPKFIQRFRQEAQASAGLHHPNIITVYEVGEEAGQYYLAMAFLPGRTLDKLVAEGPLPMEQAVSIVEQIASALDSIHERRLVHRDVKPANVMVNDEGQATLLDFGIVRAAEGTRLTTTMTVLGTPEYMAPEQAEIEEGAEVDWRADVYALGVVAYEMLVGRPPFTGKSPTAVLYKHVHEPPPAPTTLNPDLPAVLEPVLLKALAKSREERFQWAGGFARRLRRALLVWQREAQLAPLYERLQAAAAKEDWTEMLALGGQIQAIDLAYRDVPELIQQAKAQMRRPRRGPTWALVAGGTVVLAILAGLVGWGLSLWPLAKPTESPPVRSSPPTHFMQQGDNLFRIALRYGTTPAAICEANDLNPTRLYAYPVGMELIIPVPWIRLADDMLMVYVLGDTFQMGSDENEPNADSDEFPQHSVTLDGFWMDQTEVTNAQYVLCVAKGTCKKSAYADDATYNGDNYPVVGVSWQDAANYCAWAGGRLPTEAQWEYAARGTDGRIYPWGNEFNCAGGNLYDSYTGCNDGYDLTAPVGQFPDGASWCGVLDMAGNVWEWIYDWRGGYSSEAQVNPTGPPTGEYKAVRGSWYDSKQTDGRAAHRDSYTPDTRSNHIGFRCVVSPEK